MPTKTKVADRLTSWFTADSLRRLARVATGMSAIVLVPGFGGAQTVSVIYNFPGGNSGNQTYVIPAQSRGGRLYGTSAGALGMMGSIFDVSTTGGGQSLFVFDGTDGANPFGGVTLGSDGNFYGVTHTGGSPNLGVLFRISTSGAFTVLHNFGGGTDGGNPWEPPIQASDGNFYGTTSQNSTVYKYSPSAGYSVIYQFDQAHGQSVVASLIQGTDGRLYGVAGGGGSNNCGTIFKLTTAGAPVWYYSFPCDGGGSFPETPLVEASDGNSYGTTSQGGDQNNGTIFKLGSRGKVSILHRFSGGASGVGPFGLMQATDGNLYGVAGGGSTNLGVLFKLSTGGTYTVLQNFTTQTGAGPLAAPLQDSDGLLYGTTNAGGTHGAGTVYSLDLGLAPFIALVQYVRESGGTVQILGQALTGSTGVTFNGVPATSFSVISDTYMTAVVPVGATTGPVVVTTPTGTLTSNKSLLIKGSSAGIRRKPPANRSVVKH